ncbi:Gfo/Idh/MocA family oxidoreductase [Candidatus Poribacteria bacterium]|nr:Gfo/Idh/MocA family oxidoreductase [Candidatus Poribacteria bacterium]
MSMSLRVALVGCGGMGRHHLDVIRTLPNYELSALCDVSPEALTKAGEAYRVSDRFTDVGEMLDAVELDLVVVATQTRGHVEPTIAALERGVSVLCEKPIAIDLAEADRMVAAAERSGAKLSVHQQNHVHPGILRALDMIADGTIGDVALVRGRNKAGRKSGNEFMEMGTHVTDMMLRFGGAAAWCSGTVWYRGRLADAGDIMEAKQMSPGDRDSGSVMGARAFGSYGFAEGIAGELRFTDYARTMNTNYGVDVLGTDGQLAVRTGGGNIRESLWHLPRPMEGSPAQIADWRLVDLGDVEEPMAGMYRRLANAIRAGEAMPCDGATGRRALEMIHAIYASHLSDGARVPLPLAERRHPLEVAATQGA